MKKAVWSAVAAVAVLGWAAPASAQMTQDVNATVNVGQWARLSVSGGPVNFPDEDPDNVPVLVANIVNVSARARVSPGAPVSVTVVAGNAFFDSVAGTNLIPVASMTWAVFGSPGFVPGSMSTTAQTLASWTGPASRAADQTYSLPNSWSYPVGNHTVVLTYTLVTP